MFKNRPSKKNIGGLIIGHPCSGKGTLCTGVMQGVVSGFTRSIGKLIQNEIESDLAFKRLYGEMVASGEYVDDDNAVMRLVARDLLHMSGENLGIFLLDGIRTEGQVALLNTCFTCPELLYAFDVHASKELCIARGLKRGRPNETEDVLAYRYDLWEEKHRGPVKAAMARRDIVVYPINGEDSTEENTKLILDLTAEHARKFYIKRSKSVRFDRKQGATA